MKRFFSLLICLLFFPLFSHDALMIAQLLLQLSFDKKKCFVSNMLILMMIAASNAVDFSANIQIGKTLWGDFMMWSFFG